MPIPSSKWSLHRFYRKHPILRSYLPPTRILQFSSLQDFLHSYHSVYVKPDREHRGKGIMKVWKQQQSYLLVHEKGQVKRYRSVKDVYQKIKSKSLHQRYIVQKAISLSRVNGRAFDIRVMVMRNGQGRWQYAGMLAKVAGASSIVTNVARGKGYVLGVEQALRRTGLFQDQRIKQIQRQLISLSLRAAHHFDRYKRSSQIGVDFGVETGGKIKIIEVNFDFPSHSLFAKLADKRDYRRIRRLAKEYKARQSKR